MKGISEVVLEFFNQVVLNNVKTRFPDLNPNNYQLIPIPGSIPAELPDESSLNRGVYLFNEAYDLLVEAASQTTLKKCVDFFNSPELVAATTDCPNRRANLTSDWNFLSINFARASKFFSSQSTKSNHHQASIKLVESCMHIANAYGYQIKAESLLAKMNTRYYSGLPPVCLDSSYSQWNRGSVQSSGMSVIHTSSPWY